MPFVEEELDIINDEFKDAGAQSNPGLEGIITLLALAAAVEVMATNNIKFSDGSKTNFTDVLHPLFMFSIPDFFVRWKIMQII